MEAGDLDPRQRELFIELRKATKKHQYEKAVDLCNQIRAFLPDDVDAVACKCQCLIHLGESEKALQLAQNPKYQDFLVLEKAYCLYDLGQVNQALAAAREGLASGIKGSTAEGLLHLEAQLLYKMGEFGTAREKYECLARESGAGADLPAEAPELAANAYAAAAAAGDAAAAAAALAARLPVDLDGGAFPPAACDDPEAANGHAYELLYNAGCALAQAGRLAEARTALERAQGAARTLLEAGVIDEEQHGAEMDAVNAELGFVLAQLGEADDALRHCTKVFKNKSADPQLAAAAAGTFALLKAARGDPREALKRTDQLPEGAAAKLLAPQAELLRRNRCLLLMGAAGGGGSGAGARADRAAVLGAIEDYEAACPGSAGPALLRAALEARARRWGAAAALADETRARAASSGAGGGREELHAVLFKAQIFIKKGDLEGATAVLGELEGHPAYMAPGLVGARAALARRTGKGAAAAAALEDLVEGIDKLEMPDEQKAALVLGVARHHLAEGRRAAAAAALGRLLASDLAAALGPADRAAAAAAHVDALSWTDPEQAAARAAVLPSLEVEAVATPEELEAMAPPRAPRRTGAAAAAVLQGEKKKKGARDQRRVLKRRAKAREAYLKKLEEEGNYDPSRPKAPDPERWIPRKQRSYGKRGRRRNQFVGAQGAGAGAKKDEARLDAYAKAKARAEGTAKLAPQVAVANRAIKGGRRR